MEKKLGGFNLRHETGSYVDTNGMAANLGFARQYERDGYVDTLMPFFEYGRSDYTSHLDDGARGDGDQHYTGGGILYRIDRDDGLHYEAMIRAGRLSTPPTSQPKQALAKSSPEKTPPSTTTANSSTPALEATAQSFITARKITPTTSTPSTPTEPDSA